MGPHRPQDKDTICALATPPGLGALAVVRMSGSKSFSIARKLCSFLPAHPVSHRLYFGVAADPQTKEPLDEVLVSCFKKGHSFTNEESVEFSCHGGVFIFSKILEVLGKLGARMAERGEFSYRAFMNGRIDLLQAESVLELIQSRTPRAHKQALGMLRGSTSRQCRDVEKLVLSLLAHLEVNLDFCEEGIEPYSREDQKKLLSRIKKIIANMLESYQQGRLNREGIKVAIVGEVNAGKSSLFNELVREDQALVSPCPGTTRDQVTGSIMINQGGFSLKDCAGFRQNPGGIEKQGIEKTIKEIRETSLILFLIEGGRSISEDTLFGIKELLRNNKTGPECLLLISKSDKSSHLKERELFLKQVESAFLNASKTDFKPPEPSGGREPKRIKAFVKNALWISVKNKEGVEKLKHWLGKSYSVYSEDIFLVTSRQFQALNQVKSAIRRAQALIQKNESEEFIAFELRQALDYIQGLLGKDSINSSDIVKTIFQEFCIGK